MAIMTAYPGHGDRTPAAQAQRETHWRRVVDRCRKSGLTRSTFCRREGINENALTWWVGVLRERDGARRPVAAAKPKQRHRPRPAFIPVRVIEAAPAASAAPLEVVARGGRVVRIPPGFDPTTLRRVIATLEELPC